MKLSMTRRRTRAAAVMCTAALVVPLLAACGSSTPPTAASPVAAATLTAIVSASPGTKIGAAGGGGRATGTPIDIQMPNLQGSTQGVNQPNISAAANAAVQWVNTHGGVHGHPIKLTVCDLLTTPASDVACANSMVAAHPVAIVAGAVDSEDPIVTAAAAAGIPYATVGGVSAQALTSPDSFSFGPGNTGSYNLVAAHEAANGGKSVSLVLISSPGALSEIKAGATPNFAAHGVKVNVLLTSPLGQPDMAPTIAAATKPPTSGVFLDEDPTTCIAGFNARGTLQVSSSIRFYADYSCESTTVIGAANGNANGAFFAVLGDATNHSDADYGTYNSAMKKYAPSVFPIGAALVGFIPIMDLVRVMRTMSPSTPITAAHVKAALQAATKVKAFLGNGSTFTCNAKAVTGLASVCSGTSFLDKYDNGKYTFAGSATMPSAS